MRLYLDDDSLDPHLIGLLLRAGHDVIVPVQISQSGAADPVHLGNAIERDRILLTGNHGDFLHLHHLVLKSRGHHPGILAVRKDNDPTRDMTPRGIVTALGKLAASGVTVVDELHVLNHWR